MRLDRSLVAIGAMFLPGVVLPKSAEADEWNKRTLLTFGQDVEASGTVLPAGTYVFQLADSQLSHARATSLAASMRAARERRTERLASDDQHATQVG
jgi:hypothetical protein